MKGNGKLIGVSSGGGVLIGVFVWYYFTSPLAGVIAFVIAVAALYKMFLVQNSNESIAKIERVTRSGE
jgi:hypothetical protein